MQKSLIRSQIALQQRLDRARDDRGESHMLAVLGVAGVVAVTLYAFRTQIANIFGIYTAEIGNGG